MRASRMAASLPINRSGAVFVLADEIIPWIETHIGSELTGWARHPQPVNLQLTEPPRIEGSQKMGRRTAKDSSVGI
jgi:hypothetical protein